MFLYPTEVKIERLIFIFDKKDGSLFKEINADILNVEIISKLFVSADDDPNFYRPYLILENQYNELIKVISELEEYSITDFEIYLEAVTI